MIKRKKSVIALLLASMMTMSLVGCSSSKDEASNGESSLTVWSHLTPDEVKIMLLDELGPKKSVLIEELEEKTDEKND